MSDFALLCPGQGAQAVGMGKDTAESSTVCRGLWDQANEVMGRDLASICFEGPEDELTRSSNTQPGIFVVSVALFSLLQERRPDFSPSAIAGLSSGEWTALHLAGVLSFEDTLRVLEARGRFMQEACEARPGGMLSVIRLDRDSLVKVCEESGVQMANLNSEQQTVLSGPQDGIEAAAVLAKEAGAKMAIPLPVAGAFHSELMRPAAEKFESFLKEIQFSVPTIPVISNVTADFHEGPDPIRQRMVEQITSSVRWYEGVGAIQRRGINKFVECGPGKVLSGLVKRIDKAARIHTIHDLSSLDAFLSED